MIGVVDVECQAANPNMPLYPMRAFVGSPSSIRVRNVPKRIGDWCIRSVEFTAVYPDGTIKTAECVLTGGVWVGTIEGTSTSGTSQNGYTIFASGTDENGVPVTGYILGKGDIEILEANGTLNPDPTRYYVKLLSAEAETPREGDMWPVSGAYYIWQNGQAWPIGDDSGAIEELSANVESLSAELSAKQDALSEAQMDAINQDANAYYTSFYVQGESQEYLFIASSTLSKSDFAAQGVYDTTTGTWLKQLTAIRAGTNVTALESNLFKDVTTLRYFEGPSFAGIFGAQALGGCTGLQTLILPKITSLPVNFCKDCTALRNLTIPASLTSIGRNAFLNCTNLSVHFEEKSLAQVQAMANYPWGLTPSNITASKTATQEWVEEQLPTKTSDLSNDSGFITSADIITKRDLNDLNIYADPMVEHAPIEVTVWHTSAIPTLYTLNWDGSSWYYTNSETSIQIYFDVYSNNYVITGHIQDMGGTSRIVYGSFDLAPPLWSANLEAEYFYKIEIACVKAHIVTREYVDSRLSALEARIAALEGN